MSKLYYSFNMSEMKLFNSIYSSFTDEKMLYDELESMARVFNEDRSTTALFKEFDECLGASTNSDRTVEDLIYNSDPTCIELIPPLQRSGMPDIYKRLTKDEVDWFWSSMQNLCRMRSMIKACGSEVNVMERIAMDMAKDATNTDDMHSKVLSKILEGGDDTRALLSTCCKDGALNNILSSFASMIRKPGEDPIDLSGIMSLVSGEMPDEDSMMDELKSMRESGMLPFDIGDATKRTDRAYSVSDAMSALVERSTNHDNDGDEATDEARVAVETLMSRLGDLSVGLATKPNIDVVADEPDPETE